MPKVGMQPIRRKQLIEASLRVIHDVGLADASVKLIAKEASLSNGIISHYFRDKDDLIYSAARHLTLEIKSKIDQSFEANNSTCPVESTSAFLSAIFCVENFRNNHGSVWVGLYAKSYHHKDLGRLLTISRRYLQGCIDHLLTSATLTEAKSGRNLTVLIESFFLHASINPSGHALELFKSIALAHLKDCFEKR
ncbi:transcriptional regulator BetI [Pantoea sp. Ap-967]|uniref:transcriptional regulator BetI n=1 Tax=Pantoea sp. Ap-967 TaxID=2608362 RepID=UPI001423F6CB|nr:transcriptional regulator BetI [Pantoea sp. Ap-967]NIE75912.1 transcriptional regulator BetI [Pantoea sp. Ap-967]